MKINRHNFEAFLLDQLEGRLSVEDQQELEQFLLLNPDCAPELEEREPVVLKGENLHFRHREFLKKEFPDQHSVLGDHNFDMFSIARMEGDLKENQIMDHQAMLDADHQKAEEWKQWQQTRLVAESLVFPHKELLKQHGPARGRLLWISAVSAAAAVALLFVLFRSGEDLPQAQNITQAPLQVPREEPLHQELDQPAESEIVIPGEPVFVQPEPETGVPALPKETAPPASIETTEELRQMQETMPVEQAAAPMEIQPRAQAYSAMLFTSSSVIPEAEPDRITSLQIAPVPVHLSSLTLAQISDIGFQEVLENYAEEKDFSLLKIANAGINGINKLAGSDISLLASRDEEGEISGYQLRSRRFSLSRPLDRND